VIDTHLLVTNFSCLTNLLLRFVFPAKQDVVGAAVERIGPFKALDATQQMVAAIDEVRNSKAILFHKYS
jgi:hypothetical protein